MSEKELINAENLNKNQISRTYWGDTHYSGPKAMCQYKNYTSDNWTADYRQTYICQDCMSRTGGLCPKHSKGFTNANNQVEDHQHSWEIEKFAGFIKIGTQGIYIICRSCGKVRLEEIKMMYE